METGLEKYKYARKKRGGRKIRFSQGCILAAALYFLLAALLYFAAGKQLYERVSHGELESVPGEAAGEFAAGFTICQEFWCEMDALEDFGVYLTAFQRENAGHLRIQLQDKTTGQVLYEDTVDMAGVIDGQEAVAAFQPRLEGLRGHMLAIELRSEDGQAGQAAGACYSSVTQAEGGQLYINHNKVPGTLCFAVHGIDYVWTGPHYWQIVIPAGLLFVVYCLYLAHQERLGRENLVIRMAHMAAKYKFLTKQLVARDFKIKYKRSVLGALWSFVNPLLMMSVQYVVFSTIFKSDIENYPVYLLSGIVLFNFFSEATNISLFAITGNASLITKVYVPKYIYPVSKVVSTGVNLLISMLPLFLMCLATGVRVTKAWLLIPFDLAFLLVFCIGMGFILSAVMVFFRDMQFIWSVCSMVLTYATPIFYPESILPDNIRVTLGMNPMYHYIQFFRKIILEGISPQPREYFVCALFSAAFLMAGILVFRKAQDKFIFYI